MSQEEERKEDLEAAKGWLAVAKENDNKIAIQILEKFFPELRESEDERIRKELLEHCINRRDGKQVCVDASDYRRWAAWLEKQKEENFIDKNLVKEEAHRIAWEYSKHYDPLLSKESWCEMAALDMAYWLEKQGKQKSWSEEDEERIEFLIAMCDDEQAECVNNSTMYRECTETKDWLKSIKPNHWKPSEEQMDNLRAVISFLTPNSILGRGMESLYNDITKHLI